MVLTSLLLSYNSLRRRQLTHRHYGMSMIFRTPLINGMNSYSNNTHDINIPVIYFRSVFGVNNLLIGTMTSQCITEHHLMTTLKELVYSDHIVSISATSVSRRWSLTHWHYGIWMYYRATLKDYVHSTSYCAHIVVTSAVSLSFYYDDDRWLIFAVPSQYITVHFLMTIWRVLHTVLMSSSSLLLSNICLQRWPLIIGTLTY